MAPAVLVYNQDRPRLHVQEMKPIKHPIPFTQNKMKSCVKLLTTTCRSCKADHDDFMAYMKKCDSLLQVLVLEAC